MAAIEHSVATLRFFGDDLVPDELSNVLGVKPTQSQHKGERLVGPKTGRVRIAKTGMWRLIASRREPEDLEAQIFEILDQLPSDLGLWQSLASQFEIDLFCGLFMATTNDGLVLSPQALAALGQRQISLGLDVYSASEDEASGA